MRTLYYALDCVLPAGNPYTPALGVGIGKPLPVRDLQNKTIQAGTGFTGVITIEGNVHGDVFTALGTVGPGAFLYLNTGSLNFTGKRIRTNTTTATSGASDPSCTLAGDSRDEG